MKKLWQKILDWTDQMQEHLDLFFFLTATLDAVLFSLFRFNTSKLKSVIVMTNKPFLDVYTFNKTKQCYFLTFYFEFCWKHTKKWAQAEILYSKTKILKASLDLSSPQNKQTKIQYVFHIIVTLTIFFPPGVDSHHWRSEGTGPT